MINSRESCLLCQIISNKIPSYKIYEDDLTIVVLDVNGGDQVLTIADAPGAADVLTFNAAGESVLLVFSSATGWQIVVNIGAVGVA